MSPDSVWCRHTIPLTQWMRPLECPALWWQAPTRATPLGRISLPVDTLSSWQPIPLSLLHTKQHCLPKGWESWARTSPAGPEVAMNTPVIPLSPCKFSQAELLGPAKEALCCYSLCHDGSPYLQMKVWACHDADLIHWPPLSPMFAPRRSKLC